MDEQSLQSQWTMWATAAAMAIRTGSPDAVAFTVCTTMMIPLAVCRRLGIQYGPRVVRR